MLQNPAAKYRPFAPVRLTDRTWPDAVIDRTKEPLSGGETLFLHVTAAKAEAVS